MLHFYTRLIDSEAISMSPESQKLELEKNVYFDDICFILSPINIDCLELHGFDFAIYIYSFMFSCNP